MKNLIYLLFISIVIIYSCTDTKTEEKVIIEKNQEENNYFDYTNRDDQKN